MVLITMGAFGCRAQWEGFETSGRSAMLSTVRPRWENRGCGRP